MKSQQSFTSLNKTNYSIFNTRKGSIKKLTTSGNIYREDRPSLKAMFFSQPKSNERFQYFKGNNVNYNPSIELRGSLSKNEFRTVDKIKSLNNEKSQSRCESTDHLSSNHKFKNTSSTDKLLKSSGLSLSELVNGGTETKKVKSIKIFEKISNFSINWNDKAEKKEKKAFGIDRLKVHKALTNKNSSKKDKYYNDERLESTVSNNSKSYCNTKKQIEFKDKNETKETSTDQTKFNKQFLSLLKKNIKKQSMDNQISKELFLKSEVSYIKNATNDNSIIDNFKRCINKSLRSTKSSIKSKSIKQDKFNPLKIPIKKSENDIKSIKSNKSQPINQKSKSQTKELKEKSKSSNKIIENLTKNLKEKKINIIEDKKNNKNNKKTRNPLDDIYNPKIHSLSHKKIFSNAHSSLKMKKLLTNLKK